MRSAPAIIALTTILAFGVDIAMSAEPSVKCETSKVKTAGKYAACRLKAESKARKKGVATDTARCDAKLAKKWQATESKADGACPVTGDLSATQSTITGQTESIIQDLFPGISSATLSAIARAVDAGTACGATKLKEAGKYEQCVTTTMATARTKDVKADYSKCDEMLLKKWSTVEIQHKCLTTGDASAIQTKITTQVTEFAIATSAAACGNGILESGEQCEPGSALSQCADELCAKDCTCSVCCAALLEDPFTGTFEPLLCGVASPALCQELVTSSSGGSLLYEQGAAGSMCSADGTCVAPPPTSGSCWQQAYDPLSLCSAGPSPTAPPPSLCNFNGLPCPGDTLSWSDSICTARGCDACVDAGCAAGSDCGTTPCGTSCGSCTTGQVCLESLPSGPADPWIGNCCTPSCSGKECGGDGCGGSCGGCTSPEVCVAGTCTTTTTLWCGDGEVQVGEECDTGGQSVICDADCTWAVCGDDLLNTAHGEACDDGNLVNGDGCDANCSFTGCGNGIVTAGEACDDGNLTNGDGCDSTCVIEQCVPNCSGKQCGTNGCGGSCGSCTAPAVCSNGNCVCVPNCSGRVCGDNGCGGSCGSCDIGFNCHEPSGTCVVS